MKKRFTCFILLVAIFTLTILPVCATPTPRWLYTGSVTFNMYFNDEVGTIDGCVNGYADVTKIEGTITLYSKNFLGIWTKTGDSWDVRTLSDILFISETFDAVSGKKYKAELEVEVYSGSNSETVTHDATGTCP